MVGDGLTLFVCCACAYGLIVVGQTARPPPAAAARPTATSFHVIREKGRAAFRASRFAPCHLPEETSDGSMSPGVVVGQRYMSEREPELGLGVIASVDPAAKRIAIDFPATKERRLYALGTGVLKRVQFRAGDAVTTRE